MVDLKVRLGPQRKTLQVVSHLIAVSFVHRAGRLCHGVFDPKFGVVRGEGLMVH